MDDDIIKYDGNDYEVVDIIDLDNISYAFLVNINNPKDFFIRRVNDENSSLDPLDSEEEYAKVIDEFSKKHKDEVEDFYTEN